MNKVPKRERYQSILPTVVLLTTIAFGVYLVSLPNPSHMHAAGLAKAVIYLGLGVMIATLMTALYLTWVRHIFWLTKVLNIFFMVVLTSGGSLMLIVYLLGFIHNATL